ncbi:MAG: FdhF/YdeP family oxidoreductase [Bdellovibrionales bacterium]|nr:FdhF/YdeP family oxidoreductase [Bdellovibrionales bacterium]
MKKKTEVPPFDGLKPQVHSAPEAAGGLAAIVSGLQHAIGEMGPVRGLRELAHVNQMKGFDCPGCAWPDPDDRRDLTEFCENGAKAIAEEATRAKADPDFFARHSVEEMGGWTDFEIGKSGRITHPMWLKNGATHYAPISWSEALDLLAKELQAAASPDEAVFYTSGRTSNEAAYLYQLLVRLYGTNNLPDCSNMCHESSGLALKESIGIGKGSVTLEDFDHSDCILVIGQNPGTNHPRMLTTLQKAARRGARIITLNPLNETAMKRFKHPQEFWTWFGRGTPMATLHLPVRVNGDMAALKGLMKHLVEKDLQTAGKVLNHEFIRANTAGFEEFLAELKRTSWEEIVRESGLSREHLTAAAEVIAGAKAMICCWAMGITQQTDGVAIIQEIVNLLMLGGHLGRAGAGVCPVRGHSNVQGDRTMGIHENPPASFTNAISKEFGFQAPQEAGYDVVEAIRAMHDGKVRVFVGMGGNFISSSPDTEFTGEALRRTRLTVQVSTKLNRSHLVTGEQALILPCLGRTEKDLQKTGEQFITVENSMSVVHASRGNLAPQSEFLKSEVAIVCELGAKLFQGTPSEGLVPWSEFRDDYDRIRDRIERTIPGFSDFNARVRNSPGGFYLPHGVRDELRFDTSSGKAEFKTFRLGKLELPPGALMLMTVRTHDQFNTTIYGLNDRYRGIQHGRRVIFLNEADIRELGFSAGQWVDITSHFGQKERKAEKFMIVPYDIPRRCAASYFPETNVLVPIDSVVGKSNTPTYKSIVVTLTPAQGVGP